MSNKKSWGGPWTEKKLNAFRKYVWSYLTIMKNQPWKTIYFDGFAGSGTKEGPPTDPYSKLPIETEEENVYKGSAERVLTLSEELSFQYYYFIDEDEEALNELQAYLQSLPGVDSKKLAFRPGDANHYLRKLASILHKDKSFASLVFLDPFGMQIDWESIAELKGTRTDIWILIPTGSIVNRLLDRNGELPHLSKLESFFGLSKEEIHHRFYKKYKAPTDLFGEENEMVQKVLDPINKIAQTYIEQLGTIWDHVTEKPLRLDNTNGTPIFHFAFASNNPKALKIADDIIKKE